jgi:pyruvate dehydrogenase E2 component (dihydrolipoamide acetyltransferase)
MPIDVLIPPVGTNVETLTLVTWYRREGEWVEKDEPLFAVETDKATLDVEAPASGFLRRVVAAEGEAVGTLTRIAVIAAPGEELELAAAEGHESRGAEEQGGRLAERQAGLVPAAPATSSRGGRIFISPRARRLAEARGVDWHSIPGTGPEGAIVERDIRTALGQEPSA